MGYIHSKGPGGGGAATAEQDEFTELVTGNASNEAVFSQSVPEDDNLVKVYVNGTLYPYSGGFWSSGGGSTVTFTAPPSGIDIENDQIFLVKKI